jgi:Mycotoxin biosynthesis protein UstYa
MAFTWSHDSRLTGLSPRCSADISVNVWKWSDEFASVVGRSDQAHTCRNFNKLHEWALERRIHRFIDLQLFVPDDLPDPPIIS